MGQTVNNSLGLWRAFKWFFRFTAQFDAIRIIVGPGSYKVDIELPQTPSKIWMYVDQDDGSIPVCQATVNLLGATIIPGGFTITAKITSENCVVECFAEYS